MMGDGKMLWLNSGVLLWHMTILKETMKTRERFWGSLGTVLNRDGNEYKLYAGRLEWMYGLGIEGRGDITGEKREWMKSAS